MPDITDPVIIDGASAPGYVACGAPVVAIDGGGLAGNGFIFIVGSSGSRVNAINVRNFGFDGINMVGVDDLSITSCYIGTDITGMTAMGNQRNGILMEPSCSRIKIGGAGCEGNIISGNLLKGVAINTGDAIEVKGNYIGLNAIGTTAISNTTGGILALDSENIIIGGSLDSEKNIVSGNGQGLSGNGIDLDRTPNSSILGNYVGLDVTGNIGIGNAENGVSINASPGITIGGSGINEGNIISGHNFHAIVLNSQSDNAVVQGNKCGTNATGTTIIPNDDSGIIVINTSGTLIGGATDAHANQLCASASEYGIFIIASSNTTIQGNFIGTDFTKTLSLGNFAGGIRVDFGSPKNIIGGPNQGEGNTIAYNQGAGVLVGSAADDEVLISQNSIFCNVGKGINLNALGNGNHPSPVIETANSLGSAGTSLPNQFIELFNDDGCQASPQGKGFIATVMSDGSGNWTYEGFLEGNITAVAIDPGNNNTSEFSALTSVTFVSRDLPVINRWRLAILALLLLITSMILMVKTKF